MHNQTDPLIEFKVIEIDDEDFLPVLIEYVEPNELPGIKTKRYVNTLDVLEPGMTYLGYLTESNEPTVTLFNPK
jgi:hypothetical protein